MQHLPVKTPCFLACRSLMFSHLLVSKLCCGNINVHAADHNVLPNWARHWLFTSKCLLSVSRPIFFFSLIRNLFLSAQNIVFSQVSATFVLPVPFFFLFPNSQLIPNCKKHGVFTGKCCMCLSSHFFLFPNSQLIPTCAKHCVFTGRCACLSRPIFSYSLIHDLFVWRGPANGFCNLNSMRQLLIKNRKYFSLKQKQHVTNDIIHWQGHVKRISPELGNRKKMGRETHAAFTRENTMFFAVWNKLRIRE